jgi:LPS export ABC transporter protein LptC
MPEFYLAMFGLNVLKLIKQLFYSLIAGVVGASIISCKNDADTIHLFTQKKLLPTESTKNITLIYSDSGIVTARLYSPQIDRYEKDTSFIEFPKGIKLEFFNKEKKVESQLTARYAIKNNRTGIMEAKNNVEVFNKKGETFNSEHLIWNQNNHTIYSNTFVKIKTTNEIIYGDGFESNEDFSKYRIKKIRGTINLKNE